ncbi:unnamed protein product [Protopolystoma xenopodis]|uniref:Uncharacterized protein n=1 Tax=Protopolystoma xenopodis TaxID=117903 RepID=A0A448WL83_9PLAT|nr:unnamed protein product [Protopolystoma xenopodis]
MPYSLLRGLVHFLAEILFVALDLPSSFPSLLTSHTLSNQHLAKSTVPLHSEVPRGCQSETRSLADLNPLVDPPVPLSDASTFLGPHSTQLSSPPSCPSTSGQDKLSSCPSPALMGTLGPFLEDLFSTCADLLCLLDMAEGLHHSPTNTADHASVHQSSNFGAPITSAPERQKKKLVGRDVDVLVYPTNSIRRVQASFFSQLLLVPFNTAAAAAANFLSTVQTFRAKHNVVIIA